MATGGKEMDSRVTCSVCLEPYRGRQPKILPCFHTFCVPCLAGLVKRRDFTQVSDTPGLHADKEEGRSADIVTCPTCRRVIPVPAGGVTAFQTNFYVDGSSREEDGQPVPCTLFCDGDQTAQFHCGQCQNNFCPQCQRYHDKLCQGGQVRALQDPSDNSSTAQSPSHCQVRQQLQKVEDALKKLTEEERKLNQERQAMDYSINVRYATLLRHAADARDACYLSLREVCDGLTESLHSSMAEVQQTQDTLQQQLSSSQPAPVSASQLRAALFMEGELPTILNRDLDSCSLLQHHKEENASLMEDVLQSFMGKVVGSSPSSGPAQNKAPAGSSPCFQDGRGAMSSAEATNPRNLQDLYKKLEEFAGQVTSLQMSNTLLSDANSKLSTEHSALQREVTALKDRNIQLTTEQAGLQREVTAMRDKHTIIHQDLAVLTAEKDKVSAELAKLQKDVISMQADTPSATLHADVRQLKADHGDIAAKLSTVQADITAIQGDNNNMKKDSDQLKSDMTNTQGKLSHLESRFVTANTQVGFTVCLSRNVTTNKEQTLVCDVVDSNEGGGYDARSGVFTVPVTGTYCFLATTSPDHSDVEKIACLDIVIDGEVKGGVYSEGRRWSTGHAVVKLTSGQKVWLRSYGDRKYRFSGVWTHFSGMLLQAEV